MATSPGSSAGRRSRDNQCRTTARSLGCPRPFRLQLVAKMLGVITRAVFGVLDPWPVAISGRNGSQCFVKGSYYPRFQRTNGDPGHYAHKQLISACGRLGTRRPDSGNQAAGGPGGSKSAPPRPHMVATFRNPLASNLGAIVIASVNRTPRARFRNSGGYDPSMDPGYGRYPFAGSGRRNARRNSSIDFDKYRTGRADRGPEQTGLLLWAVIMKLKLQSLSLK
jgi:hypothetical protein